MICNIQYPCCQLKHIVKYYWIYEVENINHCELVYPTGDPLILFHYGNPFKKNNIDGSETVQPLFCVSGQSTSWQRIAAQSVSGVIGVYFYPHMMKALFPFSLDEITDTAIDLADVLKSAAETEDRYLNCKSITNRLQIVEKFIIENLLPQNGTHLGMVQFTVDMIINSKGANISHGKLISQSGYSERQFERIFKTYVGISSQQFIEIIRLNHAVSLLPSDRSLTQIAFDSGFYDQSHFIRTFKRLTSLTPGDFRRKTIADSCLTI